MTVRFEFAEETFVDDLKGLRCLAPKGFTFTAELADETIIDRHGVAPLEVKTGRKLVASSDADILPGCLTSCIRTKRAIPVGTVLKEEPKAKRPEVQMARAKPPAVAAAKK